MADVPTDPTALRDQVRARYASAALTVLDSGNAACCGPDASCCGADGSCSDPVTQNLYAAGELTELPEAAVLASLGRVLRPGGRFAVSDVVIQGSLPPETRKSMEQWAGCVAGALEDATYRQLLAEAGFCDIDVEVSRVYEPEHPVKLDGGQLVSAFVRATRPTVSSRARQA